MDGEAKAHCAKQHSMVRINLTIEQKAFGRQGEACCQVWGGVELKLPCSCEAFADGFGNPRSDGLPREYLCLNSKRIRFVIFGTEAPALAG